LFIVREIYPLCGSRVWRSAHDNTNAKPTNTTVTATATSALSIGMNRSFMVLRNYRRPESRVFDPDQTEGAGS
jgi:hypothetical protein